MRIGSGRRLTVAVLFLDICGFSSWPNWTSDEQDKVLSVMNLFMAEMLNIVNDYDGSFEKNTGDGLMAYFGAESSSDQERVELAVNAAVVMHYFNDDILAPFFRSAGREPIRFRVGIHLGPVTIARVATPRGPGSMVAIGTAANIANKLMNLIPEGGICIGESVYNNLPANWDRSCTLCQASTGFSYVLTGQPVRAWTLNHRLQKPYPLGV